MNKEQLSSEIAKTCGCSQKQARDFIEAYTDIVTKALASNDNIQIVGFGNLKISQRKATTGRDPRSGEAIKIPAKKVVKFSPAQKLKEAVNN